MTGNYGNADSFRQLNMMRRVLLLVVLLLMAASHQATDCVVLLHGLARTSTSMNKMQRALKTQDSRRRISTTRRVSIRSRNWREIAVPEGLEACRDAKGVGAFTFVTHSLGGILVRQYLSTKEIAELGRVVMLGPPNQGSAAVDELGGVPGFDWLNGPAGRSSAKARIVCRSSSAPPTLSSE